MEQMFEFISSHPYLWLALLVVIVMLIKFEYESWTSQSVQISPTNAIRLINNNDDALILDVRESGDFAKGHIKGARNQSFSTFKDNLDKFSQNKNSVVLAYCASGAMSAKACRVLTQAGFTNVHNIAGGINRWLDAKLPTTTK